MMPCQFRIMTLVKIVAASALILFVLTTRDRPGRGITDKRIVIPVACVVAAVYAVGSMRRPIAFSIPMLFFLLTPSVDHPSHDVINACLGGCFLAWIIGAPIGVILGVERNASRD